jgi:hypothetical protein
MQQGLALQNMLAEIAKKRAQAAHAQAQAGHAQLLGTAAIANVGLDRERLAHEQRMDAFDHAHQFHDRLLAAHDQGNRHAMEVADAHRREREALTSPRLRGEGDARSASGEGGFPNAQPGENESEGTPSPTMHGTASHLPPPLAGKGREGGDGPREQGSERRLPIGARRAKDGRYYLPDPNRPGKYLMVVGNA